MKAIPDFPWNLIVLIPQLDSFKNTETNGIDENKASVNASGVDNKYLLI